MAQQHQVGQYISHRNIDNLLDAAQMNEILHEILQELQRRHLPVEERRPTG